MAVTPSGKFALRLDETADLIAQCSAFQSLVGAGSAAAAKLRIHLLEFDEDETVPLACVGHLAYVAEKATSSFKFDVTEYQIGALILLEPPTTNVETKNDEVLSFLNTMSSIDDQIEEALGSDPGAYPSIFRRDLQMAAPDSDKSAKGRKVYEALYAFDINGHT